MSRRLVRRRLDALAEGVKARGGRCVKFYDVRPPVLWVFGRDPADGVQVSGRVMPDGTWAYVEERPILAWGDAAAEAVVARVPTR
ncbi:hypothetical protein BJF79_00495 [Actinomadura sp. CNU-125]|uniref:hypothetical protein n=1 Tax=Actinomadura sp. CNU-125 TaxID=1904961 RepID=UPI00095DB0BF|nr:hypothetical protein [Actinomadura sp. CNU-125]OLT31710.1 hypothetical protein BJF79_00495 [Actinomadura sp. CNU-125]